MCNVALQDGFLFTLRFAIGYIPLLSIAYLIPEYRVALDPGMNGCRWIILVYYILWLSNNRCNIRNASFAYLFSTCSGSLPLVKLKDLYCVMCVQADPPSLPAPSPHSYESMMNQGVLRIAGHICGVTIIFGVLSISSEAAVVIPCTSAVVFVFMFLQPEQRSRLFRTPDSVGYFFSSVGIAYSLIFSKVRRLLSFDDSLSSSMVRQNLMDSYDCRPSLAETNRVSLTPSPPQRATYRR